MKAIVISAFRDKENKGKLYKPGDEFEGKSKRVKDLQERKFLGEEVIEQPSEDELKVEAPEEPKEEIKEKNAKKGK